MINRWNFERHPILGQGHVEGGASHWGPENGTQTTWERRGAELLQNGAGALLSSMGQNISLKKKYSDCDPNLVHWSGHLSGGNPSSHPNPSQQKPL